MPESPLPRRAYVQIDIEERRQIDCLVHRRVPIDEIATRLGRHRSAIYRELRRNRFTEPQLPDLNGYCTRPAFEPALGALQRPHARVIDA